MTGHVPIIFSAPMIRALLDGRKTQTRRVLKPQPCVVGLQVTCPPNFHYHAKSEESRDAYLNTFCRYAPGDRLWVREAWADLADTPHCDLVRNLGNVIAYRATDDDEMTIPPKWRSPIFLRRSASRLTLTVTDVRVQRLQDITEADAVAEGGDPVQARMYPELGTRRDWFHDLWNSLHGAEAWGANPWVAAISFTVERRNIDT